MISLVCAHLLFISYAHISCSYKSHLTARCRSTLYIYRKSWSMERRDSERKLQQANVQAAQDAAFASVSGAVDLTQQLSPGDVVRVGDDQALGDTTTVEDSPLLATANDQIKKVVAGQRIRVAGDEYTLQRTGAESFWKTGTSDNTISKTSQKTNT